MAKRASKASAAKVAKPIDVVIYRAYEAAKGGNRAAVVEALLEAWAVRPVASLANAIVIATGLQPERPELVGKTKVSRAAWTELCESEDPLAIPALLATLTSDSANVAMERLEQLDDWPADPRIDDFLFDLLTTVPYTYYGSRPFWYAVLDRARKARDPRIRARFANARRAFNKFGSGIRDTMLRRLEVVLTELDGALGTAPELSLEESMDLDNAIKTLGKQSRGTAAKRTGNELLGAIFDDPSSNDARTVYADFLQQREDPHGELIALQLGGKLDKVGRAREKELITKHCASFMGPLYHSIQKRGMRFERGFLARCVITPDSRACIGDRWWSTVRDLDGGSVELLLDPVMRGLERLVLYHQCWGALARVELRALRELDIRLPLGQQPRNWNADARALGSGKGLPALRSLSIVIRDAWAGWRPSFAEYKPILTGDLVKQLEVLRIECSHMPDDPRHWQPRSIGAWLAALRGANVPVPVLELDDGIRSAPVIYRFEKTDRHRLCSIEAHFGRDDSDNLTQIVCTHLGTLEPDDVAGLTFRFVGTKLTAESKRMLRAAVQRFPKVMPVGL